jgi:hypothetical protein
MTSGVQTGRSAYSSTAKSAIFLPRPADDARYFSQLGPSYLKYERALFVDTLNDWEWFGTGSPPPWYTGEPWT